MSTIETVLARANRLLREGRLEEALRLYEVALQETRKLAHHIRFNMRLAKKWLAAPPFTASESETSSSLSAPIAAPSELAKPEGMDDYTFERIVQSGLFSVKWYLEQYGHLLKPGENPLAHYLEHGVQVQIICDKPTLILAITARTGSTQLCSVLESIKAFGKPTEIFNPRGVVQHNMKLLNAYSFSDYIQKLSNTDAPFFSFKVSWNDFEPISGVYQTLFPQAKFFYWTVLISSHRRSRCTRPLKQVYGTTK